MAFSTCGRGSHPHSVFMEHSFGSIPADARAYRTPFHYVRGVIHEHGTGERYAVEPRHFDAYRRFGGNARVNVEHVEEASSTQQEEGDKEAAARMQLGDHVTYRVHDFATASGFELTCNCLLYTSDAADE